VDAAELAERFSLMGGAVAVVVTGLPVYLLCVRKNTLYGWLQKLNGKWIKTYGNMLNIF